MKQCGYQLLLMYIISTSTEASKTEDYCWRDYDGTIPIDAFQINQPSKFGRPVYAGQDIYTDKIIPGKIYELDDKIYFEHFDSEIASKESVKILCIEQPKKFRWVPTYALDIPKLPSQQLIKGGFELKCSIYIGRVKIDGDYSPGKVVCCSDAPDCYGLYTTHNGTGSRHLSFEILRYSDTVSNPDIDIRIKGTQEPNGKCKQVIIQVFN